MTNELKPCPFCGSEARGIADGYVFCDCGASAPIEAWNTRAERTCQQIDERDPCVFVCSLCEHITDHAEDERPKYCPSCGAKIIDKVVEHG